MTPTAPKVLVVGEDAPWIAWRDALQARGLGATYAPTEEAALASAREATPAAVLVFERKSSGPGMAVCHAFRRDASLRSVPILMVGLDEDVARQHRMLKKRADGYLGGDAQPAEVVAAAEEMIRRGRLPDPVVPPEVVQGERRRNLGFFISSSSWIVGHLVEAFPPRVALTAVTATFLAGTLLMGLGARKLRGRVRWSEGPLLEIFAWTTFTAALAWYAYRMVTG